MPQAKDPEASYPDLHHVMDAALDSENGVTIDYAEWTGPDGEPLDNPAGAAFRAQQNIYTIRMRDRKRNMRLYSEDHPMYGRSEYDKLTVRRPANSSKLHIMRGDHLLKSITMRDPITGEELG